MAWYTVLVIGLAAFGFGYGIASLVFSKMTRSVNVGTLCVTKLEKQPYLVASVPMENIMEHKYVTFNVHVVDDSQK